MRSCRPFRSLAEPETSASIPTSGGPLRLSSRAFASTAASPPPARERIFLRRARFQQACQHARSVVHLRRATARVDLSRSLWRPGGRSEALRELSDARTQRDDGGRAALRRGEAHPAAALSHSRALHAGAPALRAGRGWRGGQGRARQVRRRAALAQLRPARTTEIGAQSDERAGGERAGQDGPTTRSVGGACPPERNTAS